MSLGEWIAGGGGIVFLLLSLIQIAPIKANPWSAIAKGLGKAINADVLRELEEVKKTQQETQAQLTKRVRVEDERNADSQRERILRFNVELMRNIRHTREDFIEILTVIDSYEEYCKEHEDYKNNRAVFAVKNIGRVYEDRLEKNDFI
ncbi:MAG: hypothetical protein LUD01_01470 [Clostridiales bacterium]|nr:hypothetical protein [Clostridiales bacterium]